MLSQSTSAQRLNGFTLIELMLIVAIIGILSAIAIPKYMTYQCRAKQIEARKALASLAKMQNAFYAENDHYSTSFDSVGFSLKGKQNYDYSMQKADNAEFLLQAEGKAGIFKKPELWTMDTTLTLTNLSNGCR